MQHLIRVWDGFIRSFHWLLLLLLIALWITGGDLEYIDLHKNLGLIVLALIISRIMWGIVGSKTAKFSHFVRSPFAAVRYLRDEYKGRAREPLGHNPAGGYMILLLLGLVLAQAVSGLFTNDDLFFVGPLANLVEYDTQRMLTRFHRNNFDWLLVAVVIHVIAIFVYMFKGKDLLTPMFSGNKKVKSKADVNGAAQAKPKIVHGGIGVAIFAGNLIWVFWWLG